MSNAFPSLLDPSPADGRVLVFDSGVGGLTVAEEIRMLGPRLAVDYAADTAFFPYGDKADDALRARLPIVATRLVEAARPDVLVIACNTASTLALDGVRAALDIPVVGTVPAIKPAVAMSRTGVIGLLATPGTLRRTYTKRLIDDFADGVHVIQHGSVDLVRLAEANAAGDARPLGAFEAVQAPLFSDARGCEIDTIVLACTHFPLVRRELQASAPRPVAWVDSGAAIARQTIRVLPKSASGRGDLGGRVFTTSDGDLDPAQAAVFRRFGFARAYTAPVDAPATGNGTTSADGE